MALLTDRRFLVALGVLITLGGILAYSIGLYDPIVPLLVDNALVVTILMMVILAFAIFDRYRRNDSV